MTSEPCTVRAEHGDCGAHPSTEPNPWTDEWTIVENVISREQRDGSGTRETANAVLAALAPRLAERERAAQAEIRDDLAQRLERAIGNLNTQARAVQGAGHLYERSRLEGKANGVALALSYVQEIERGER